MTLNDLAVNDVLKATPKTTITSAGTTIQYPFRSPADWRDHWIYFLLVDRFDNPAGPPDPDIFPCLPYQGGTFAGIQQRLPYLKELGVGALWISPVLINPQWFTAYWGGYGTLNFIQIEPRFCSDPAAARLDPTIADKEFRTLVDEAHALGIYVILDIVLNHTGDVFNYEGERDDAPWNDDREYNIYWRNEEGVAQGQWTDISNVSNLHPEAGIWPKEFQRNDYFRRRGGNNDKGDFGRMKELVTEYLIKGTKTFPVRNHLIKAYQYLIAKFDLDGFRIDTLMYVEPEFARVFGNSMREYALSIGKKNFFTFGEIWVDDEARIAEFIGRNTENDNEFTGVDAAIDFPMRTRLVQVCKGFAPPEVLSKHFDERREKLKKIVSSHGEASRYYVTFLDNHDLTSRFHIQQYEGQTKIALVCLMTMQGIPSIYYGNEQGLEGNGNDREYSRQALWGLQNAFSNTHTLYQHIRDITTLRNQQPALRYGRQYFRPCSNDGTNFMYSPDNGGILAFSRILNDHELLIVVNTSTSVTPSFDVIVDANLNEHGKTWDVLFPENWQGQLPEPTKTIAENRTVRLTIPPMEALVLG